MRKTLIRVSGLSLLAFLIAVLSAASLSGQAFAQNMPAPSARSMGKVNPISYSCRTLLVHLNGRLPATQTCLDAQASTASNTSAYSSPMASPRTSRGSCSNTNDLDLWQNANGGGYELCLIGSGFANMPDFTMYCTFGVCINWNDQASSFWGGCSPATFYVDTNGNGAHSSISPFQGRSNFPYGNIGNDKLSSVSLSSSCS